MTTHPEDAMTRDRALADLLQRSFAIDAALTRNASCSDQLLVTAAQGITLGDLRYLMKTIRALSSAKQEPAPSAEVEEAARESAKRLTRLAQELSTIGHDKELVQAWEERFADEIVTALRRYAGDGGVTWRPIETAPRHKEVIIALYDDRFVDPVIMNSMQVDRDEQGWVWTDWHGYPPPTHWMPIPPAPIELDAPPAARAKPSEKGGADV
jgi:hypothetical protein